MSKVTFPNFPKVEALYHAYFDLAEKCGFWNEGNPHTREVEDLLIDPVQS